MTQDTTPLPPTNVFHISFETKGHAGYIKAVKVTIEHDVMDTMDEVRVDLADHPLYRALQSYVKGNPR
jgi:hypothetical protein